MSDQNLKGWDLIYRLIEHDVNKKEDLLVALVHLILINCDYKCIGLGDSKEITGNEKCSEVLPAQWNTENSIYYLRYLKDNKLFNFSAMVVEDEIVLNLLNVKEVGVNTISFSISKTVRSLRGEKIHDLIPDYDEVIKQVKCTLANFSANKEAQTQTCKENTSQPLRVNRSQSPASSGIDPIIRQEARINPFDYGRADLDPFAAPGRGGMIFDPMNPRVPSIDPGLGIPGQLPRGARPPGARFDPMGPPDLERRPRPRLPPDSDDMPPPGYEDMFM